MRNKKAIVFLCKELKSGTKDFANKVYKETDFDVFIVVDSQKEIRTSCNAYVVQIQEETCEQHGYKGCNINKYTHIEKEIISWDKMLYYFCEVENKYDFLWVFEDDVFIPSIESLINLDKYSNYDLVVPNNHRKNDDYLDWHWRHILDKTRKPFYYSMVCAIGISKRLIEVIKEYVKENKRLFYIESMFNTLAMQKGLFVKTPLELSSIVWMGDWTENEYLLLPNNMFHPVKDIEKHEDIRKDILEKKLKGFIPKNNLPDFILKKMQDV